VAVTISRGHVLRFIDEPDPPDPDPDPDPEPDPDPPPPSSGEAMLQAAMGIRTGHNNLTTYAAFKAEFGKDAPFFRHVLDSGQATGEPFLKNATSNAWDLFLPHDDLPGSGFITKFPAVSTSVILPIVSGPYGMTQAERTARYTQVAAGTHDATFEELILDRADSTKGSRVYRFCVNSEADIPGHTGPHGRSPFSKTDISPTLYQDASEHVHDMVHAHGHLVCYAGNGHWHRTTAPGGLTWWEYAMPDLSTWDIFGLDEYWGETSPGVIENPNNSINRIRETQRVALSLGKKVAFPEYGVQMGMAVSDQAIIDWFNTVWSIMASWPTTGAGSLDHHCIWSENYWNLNDRPAVKAAVIDRFGA